MIVFEQCRIDDRSKCLIVDAKVENFNYFDKVYIDRVHLYNQDSYTGNGLSSNEPNKVIEIENTKEIHLRIPYKELPFDLSKDIIFIYVHATGVPDISACPCGRDNELTLGIAVNMRPLYNMAMGYINELNSDCNVPKGFIDMFLRLHAFKYALKTGNFKVAIDYWNKLFKFKKKVTFNKGCGCHGIN